MSYRVIFFGSPQFAVPSLEALAADSRLEVVSVVTQPDRVSGRGRRETSPPVKVAAERLDLPVLQPATLRDGNVIEDLRHLDADIFIVVAYGEILRRAILEMPRFGCLNVHPSLLPRYRGSAPIQAAIANGDSETGVTIMQLVRRLDAGPILARKTVTLDGTETAGTLSEKLAEVAASLLPDVAVSWCEGRIRAIPQDDEAATLTRELRKENGKIDWDRSAVEIERHIRAMTPWPSAWTTLNGRRLTILEAAIDPDVDPQTGDLLPGSLRLVKDGVLVGTGSGTLRLLAVQPEGRKAMNAVEWARGARLSPDDRLGDQPA